MTRRRAPAFLRGAKLELGLAALVAVLFGDYLFSDRLLFGSDSIPGGLFFRSLLVDFVRAFHALPRWNPYILGGLPFLDATHGDTFFPSSLLQFAMPVYRGMGHKLVLHVFLAGVFMAFYLRSLRLSPSAVAFGAVAYMLCPIFVTYLYAGQDGKMYVTSLAPLILGLLERAMSRGRLGGFVLLGVALGVTILSAQIQMAYHLTWFLGALFVLRLVRGGVSAAPVDAAAPGPARPSRARLVVLFSGAVLLALLVAAIQLVPAVAFVKNPAGFSVRSTKTDYEHAASWSLHPEELASMVVPEFCNAPNLYWGRNPFKLNADYAGILPMFLAVLALRRRDATRIFLASLVAFCVLYSLGPHTPLHRLFYAFVPQVKLFRAPPLVMFGAAFGLCALAAHAIHDRTEPRAAKAPPRKSRMLEAGLGAAAVIALAGLAGGSLYSAWNDLLLLKLDATQRRVQLGGVDAFRNGALFIAAVLAAGTLLLHAWRRGGVPRNVAIAGLLFLTVVDGWRVDRRFVAIVDPRPFLEPSPLLARLRDESRTEKFRVYPLAERLQQNEMGYFGIESVFGFHDNELAWYRSLREEPAAKSFFAANASGYPFLRVLNVKYVVHDQKDLANPYPVPGFLPRFRLVSDWEIAHGPGQICARLLADDFDPERTVLLEENPPLPKPAAPAPAADVGRVVALDYEGNVIRVEVDASAPCFLVQAENWFPYWHCTDETGRELPILRAYGAMRAIPLEVGHHQLTLAFRSQPYETGKAITLGSLVVAAALFALGSGRRPRGTAT